MGYIKTRDRGLGGIPVAAATAVISNLVSTAFGPTQGFQERQARRDHYWAVLRQVYDEATLNQLSPEVKEVILADRASYSARTGSYQADLDYLNARLKYYEQLQNNYTQQQQQPKPIVTITDQQGYTVEKPATAGIAGGVGTIAIIGAGLLAAILFSKKGR